MHNGTLQLRDKFIMLIIFNSNHIQRNSKRKQQIVCVWEESTIKIQEIASNIDKCIYCSIDG